MEVCRKSVFICFIIVCNLYLLYIRLKYKKQDQNPIESTEIIDKPTRVTVIPSTNETATSVKRLEDRALMEALLKQRNQLSRQLNELRKDLGQYECKKRITSFTGGWCLNIGRNSSKAHVLDLSLANAISNFLAGKKVASFGEGPGLYKSFILQDGQIDLYDAFDGAPFSESISEGAVRFLDLTVPQYGLRLYDWVISLEVAEHIPRQYERVYLDNLFRHARSGIILSWATPDQKGLSHINGRPFKYVKETMTRNGFEEIPDLSTKLQNAAETKWLKENVHVYKRVGFAQYKGVKHLKDWYI